MDAGEVTPGNESAFEEYIPHAQEPLSENESAFAEYIPNATAPLSELGRQCCDEILEWLELPQGIVDEDREKLYERAAARFQLMAGFSYEEEEAVESEEIVLRRATIWAATDDVFSREVKNELQRLGAVRQVALVRELKEQLMPDIEAKDPAAFFDPLKWDLSRAKVSTRFTAEAFGRLGLIRLVMVRQERGLKRNNLTTMGAARLVTKARKLGAHSTGKSRGAGGAD